MRPPTFAKQMVKAVLRSAELDIVRKRRHRWLSTEQVQTVIDVGANTGQFATLAREYFPKAHIYSFEPLADCYESLVRTFSHDKRFTAYNFAVGDQPGETAFFRSSFAQSSSILPMAELHQKSFPYSRKLTKTIVDMRTLDEVCDSLPLEREILVKLDVQGFEDRVIRGGQRTIGQAKLVLTEVSFEPLYEGQALFSEVYRLLSDLGFQFHGTMDQLQNPVDGRILQADALFARPGLGTNHNRHPLNG